MTFVQAAGIRFSGQDYLDDPSRFYPALEESRRTYGFARCLCKSPARQLVIREVKGVLYLAVWPNDGHNHSSICQFYREPSGMPNPSPALPTQPNHRPAASISSSGQWDINIELPRFSVDRPISPDSTKSPSQADSMSLASFLAWIWDSTNMARWVAGWRRDWWSIHRIVKAESRSIRIHGAPLESALYIPPPFRRDQERAIHQEFADFQASISGRPGTYGLVLCEIKAFDKSSFGYKVSLKNVAKPFFMDTAVFNDIARHFALQLAMVRSQGQKECSVIALFTVEMTSKGNVSIVDAALQLASKSYVPVNTGSELALCNLLVAESRTFTRGMGRHIGADFVLRDTSPPTALLIYSLASPEYVKQRDTVAVACEDAGCRIWKWDQFAGVPIPSLPPPSAKQD